MNLHTVFMRKEAAEKQLRVARFSWSRVELAVVWLCLFAVVVGLQAAAGAYTSEFSAYPDEASHYVSGLLVRSFIAEGFPASPVTYAEHFYLRYPYLAIGHWPPVFYILEGVWMLLFTPSRTSVLLLVALITAALAVTAHRVLRAEFGRWSSLAVALLLVSAPVVQKYASAVMLDILVALLCFGAALCFGRYLDSCRWQEAAQFAALASLAILTKGNGLVLALVPPLAMLFTRRFSLLSRPAFWFSALAASVLSLPWTLWTLPLVIPTWAEPPSLSFVLRAVGFYGAALLAAVGPAIVALAIIGFAARVIKPFNCRQVEGKWAAAAALLLGVLVFQSAVPAGMEPRFLIPALPPLLMFSVAGASYVAQRTRLGAFPVRWVQNSLVVLATLIFLRHGLVQPKKTSYGFIEAVEQLEQREDFKNSLTLVSSETAVGEGIFVSEVAMNSRQKGRMILRASKALAETDWRNDKYRPLYSTVAELMQCMDAAPIDFLVLDTTPGGARFEHHRQLLEIVRTHPDLWRLRGVYNAPLNPSIGGGSVYVYEAAKRRKLTTPRFLPAGISTSLGGHSLEWPIRIRLSCVGMSQMLSVGTTAQ